VAAASENDAVTSDRISAGLSTATKVATMAAASSANLDRITRFSDTTTTASRAGGRRTSALLMVSSSPSAVDSAAASPPAATRPDTT
jgi:hypothetical protein